MGGSEMGSSATDEEALGARRERTLAIGDNLDTLTRLTAGSVTLAYLDPPFNSGREYEARLGRASAGTAAFTDSWGWGLDSAQAMRQLPDHLPPAAVGMVRALVEQLGPSATSAYLVHLAVRLGEVCRVLSPQGSLYLHCDSAASHYIKIVLDSIFGPGSFRNEIIWRRTHAHSSSRRFGPVHDVILYYTKSAKYVWNQLYSPYSAEYTEQYFRYTDKRGRYQSITCTAPGDRIGTRAHYQWKGQWPPPGRHWAWTEDEMRRLEAEDRLVYSRNGVPRRKRYVDDGEGVRLQDIWSDVASLSAHSNERVGYDTQKPTALVERIVAASSRPGDLVLDPYCGTGTTAVAAERLGRRWLVADASVLAAGLTLARVRAVTPASAVQLIGFPSDVRTARALLKSNPDGYGAWATALLATELDRKSHTSSLAIGRRSWDQGIVGLVPVSGPALPMRIEPRQYSTALVVEGRDSADLAAALTRTGVQDVQQVPLRALACRQATAVGRANCDLRLNA